MLKINKKVLLLSKTQLGFENEGVLNPAVILHDNVIHLFYRAVSTGNRSTIGYCKLSDPFTIAERWETPILSPQAEYESQGIEDPRIVKIDNLFYLTYTAYDGINALGALALSADLLHFEMQGIIAPQISYDEMQSMWCGVNPINAKYLRFNERERVLEKQGRKVLVWDKNLIFFPRRINGKLNFLHRIRPDIQLVAVNELSELTPTFWQEYFLHLDKSIVLSSKHKHEVSYIGGGCPPIETKEGWLLIYHGVHDTVDGYVYAACAALLDIENPTKEIARLPYPLLKPEKEWEKKGYVNNVCFPSGAVVVGDELYIYYGAADEHIACASLSISKLLEELMIHTKAP